MGSAFTTIAPKLAKLIPMLSAEHESEIVSVVRAMARTLQRAGLDFHALSHAVARSEVQIAETSSARPKRSEPQSSRSIALWLLSHAQHRMDPKERRFVSEIAGQLNNGRSITAKQENWLRSLQFRLGGEYVR